MRAKPYVKGLRLFHRLAGTAAVQALPHPAFRMLTGMVLEWDGNSGAIEFTQRRHGKTWGIDHPAVFAKALRCLIDAKLVLVTDAGGGHRAAKYALVNVPIEAAPRRSNATRRVANDFQKITTPRVVIEALIATSRVADCYTARSNENDLHIKNARAHTRASELGKEKSEMHDVTDTNSQTAPSANQSHAMEADDRQPNSIADAAGESFPRVSGSDVAQSDNRQGAPNLRIVRAS